MKVTDKQTDILSERLMDMVIHRGVPLLKIYVIDSFWVRVSSAVCSKEVKLYHGGIILFKIQYSEALLVKNKNDHRSGGVVKGGCPCLHMYKINSKT